jgi:hypothetical protein
MSKYEPLGAFLRSQKFQNVPMTFAEIEKLLKFKLPASKKYPAWWSNNPSNNVMTQQWLDAGYETESVDIRGEKLVFRRKGSGTTGSAPGRSSLSPGSGRMKRESIFGCLKGLFTLSEGFDPTAPMELEPDWDRKYRLDK